MTESLRTDRPLLGRLGFDEVVSFTAAINHKSRRVMDKIGLQLDRDGDFEHPVRCWS